LNFVSLDSKSEYDEFTRDQPLLNTPRGIPEFLRRHTLPKVIVDFRKIAQQICARDTVLLTRDLFDIAPRFVSEKLGLPLIWVFMNPSQIATWRLRAQLFGRILGPDIGAVRSSLGLPSINDNQDYWSTYPNCIALWPEWFAPVSCEVASNVVAVGFMTDNSSEAAEVPDAIRRALTDGEPRVLITAGTGTYLGPRFYCASADACKISNLRGIIVSQHAQKIQDNYPNCVSFVGYVPFGTLMRHTQAIIHHGGLGTLSCAMAAGIPQVVLPLGADRPDNAMRLQRLGVGEALPPPKWIPEKIAATLVRLLNSSTVAQNCKFLAEQLKNDDAATTACEVVERTTRQDAA
jgi:UDP:flavonoid glycosyltransferase YjiC (YdhE family)